MTKLLTREQTRDVRYEASMLILEILEEDYCDDMECKDIREAVAMRVEGYLTCCEHCTIECTEENQIFLENLMMEFIEAHKAGRDAIQMIEDWNREHGMYELHYANGGHGGPHHGLKAAKLFAEDLLRNPASSNCIECRPYNSPATGGFRPGNPGSVYIHKEKTPTVEDFDRLMRWVRQKL